MKLLKKHESYVKDKKPVDYTAYYLDFENGVKVKIIPVFRNDYNVLKILASECEK